MFPIGGYRSVCNIYSVRRSFRKLFHIVCSRSRATPVLYLSYTRYTPSARTIKTLRVLSSGMFPFVGRRLDPPVVFFFFFSNAFVVSGVAMLPVRKSKAKKKKKKTACLLYKGRTMMSHSFSINTGNFRLRRGTRFDGLVRHRMYNKGKKKKEEKKAKKNDVSIVRVCACVRVCVCVCTRVCIGREPRIGTIETTHCVFQH